MLFFHRRIHRNVYFKHIMRRYYCQNIDKMSKIRNIGILAHIDAGKTTTTERMLFYSGLIHSMGEVHDGNTVTDYMDQERNRGITITSAAVTLPWKKHNINLVDTPGHIDFTMQVEQTLNILDGAVIVLDSSAGVEAQTLTVWRQTDRYMIPRIVYANKMDRSDASLPLCINLLKSKFNITPLQLQIPVRESNGRLIGLIDVLKKDILTWHGDNGQKVISSPIEDNTKQWEALCKVREVLIGDLADMDETVANIVLNSDNVNCIDYDILLSAIRRACISQKGVPLFCGSSYKNIGVQTLMDGIIDYLPSPNDCITLDPFKCFGTSMSARAFKIVHEKQKGPVTFLRIYTGTLEKGQKLYNASQSKSENINRVMIAYADDYKEVNNVESGNIVAVTGLKNTVCGDLLSNSNNAVKNALTKLSKSKKMTQEESIEMLGVEMSIPDPVFFCSIEPPSQAYQLALDNALSQLHREDPSLRIQYDEETGQTILAGMGELHLEVIGERIKTEFKIDIDLSRPQISYKEGLMSEAKESHRLDLKIGSTTHSVYVVMSILKHETNKKMLSLDQSPDNASNTAAIYLNRLNIITSSAKAALAHGPKLGCPVINVRFVLHWLEVGKGTSDTVLSSAVNQCVQKLLKSANTILLEPIMNVEVVTDDDHSSAVLSDFGRRRGSIQDISTRSNYRVINALVPLADLLGYSKDLRTFTSGTASFSMEFHSYQEVSAKDEGEAIKNITGFYPF
ncbi:ribosome-releasing factor 2, mitochondrial [Rhopalosiphum padi]|uniref:ribosome-releasing factor 2, mitochondrial n=1 Tax=Rhopalosiphum padi TaxID=40932 RepID=UPI00298D7185|nr:ribosome-releasing factor 2, mitochondrial [Rhopalosiphum padi]XP_060834487.1 ribosome-releasing factor 2, mitochondrial [Rhopalosiphum padi]